MLANIAGENQELKKLVISRTTVIDSITTLIMNINNSKSPVRQGLLENIIWCTSNLCRRKIDYEDPNNQGE